MSVFARLPDVITRDPVAVMSATCADELSAIQELWPWFETLVGLRGRKMYAAAEVVAGTYTTCTPLRPGDDAGALGLEVGELAGGRFRRGRLRGEAPGVYELIGPGIRELEAAGPVDRSRPVVEFYKRSDEIELWVPVPDTQGVVADLTAPVP
jgi:hypothetical protein